MTQSDYHSSLNMIQAVFSLTSKDQINLISDLHKMRGVLVADHHEGQRIAEEQYFPKIL